MNFTDLNLDERILKGISDMGFTEFLEVQEETIPPLLDMKDVLVQSQTGTGKTAAFLIPVFQIMLNDKSETGRKAIIIAPTRELAVQIEKEARLIGKYLDFKIGCFFGGMSYNKQEKVLENGVDIIIGTPGRLIDFGEQGKFKFKDIDIVVIDEADRLFDMGFMPDIRRMLRQMPPREKRLTMLFSATLSTKVKSLAWNYMNEEVVEIEINPEMVTVDNINQELFHIGKKEKMKLLLGILEREKPENCIIFTNTKSAAYEVAKRLEHNGFHTEFLMGDLQQKKRLKIIEKVKSGEVPLLVATDVAARGLHIEDLEMVINYDLPEDSEAYVHRIGRTARVGKSGKAVTFACEKFVYGLESLESYINKKIPVAWAESDLLIEDKSAGMRFRLDQDDKRSGGGKHQNRKKTTEHRRSREAHREKTGKPVYKGKGKEKKTSPGKFENKQYRDKSATRKKEFAPEKTEQKRKGKDLRKKALINPSKNGSLEERIEYYRSKYGEDFKPSEEMLQSEKLRKKKSLFGKIKSFFGPGERGES
jgi:ATP-dependent RNA helicase RhlB